MVRVSQAALGWPRRQPAVFGRPALKNRAGLRPARPQIRDVWLSRAVRRLRRAGRSEMWNIQISDQVTAPVMRQTIKRGLGNM
jgi:hypothetical protein